MYPGRSPHPEPPLTNLADHPAVPTPVSTRAAALPPAGYRMLRAWQRALDVAAHAHRLAHTLPAADQDALGAELRRAGAAVPAHIASGNLADDPREHRRALLAAQIALARLETLALLAERLDLAPAPAVAALLAESADTRRLVRGLARVVGAGRETTRPTAACPTAAHPPARARRTARLTEPARLAEPAP